MNQEMSLWLTTGLFTLTYAGLALGRVPGLHIDRSGIAVVGATLMLVTGMVSFQQAVSPQAIDYETLVLLFGMMVVVAYLTSHGCSIESRTSFWIESATLWACLP